MKAYEYNHTHKISFKHKYTTVHSFFISASLLQRKKKEGGIFINIYWPLLSSSLQRSTTRRASLPSLTKQQLVEGASGWWSGDSNGQQQMLASVERKYSLDKRHTAVWAVSDNEGLAAYLLHCPWGEVITMSMCMCVCEGGGTSPFRLKLDVLNSFVCCANINWYKHHTSIGFCNAI